MSEVANLISGVMGQAAQDTAGWTRGRVLSEDQGRYSVSLASGAEVTIGVSSPCYDPVVGEAVDISQNNGMLSIEGPSAFG